MYTPEEDVIIFENVCEINYYKHQHICVFVLIYLDAEMYESSEAIYTNVYIIIN